MYSDAKLTNCSSPDHLERVVYVVDDDDLVRSALDSLLRSLELKVFTFSSMEEFIAAPRTNAPSCLVLDVRLRGKSGLALPQMLRDLGLPCVPIVYMTGHGDIAMTVKAMKAGAVDFLAKPFRDFDMIEAVFSALETDARQRETDSTMTETRNCWNSLTPREREVTQLVATGLMNKQVADRLGIAEITVKIHRGQAMRKMASRSLAELVRKMESISKYIA